MQANDTDYEQRYIAQRERLCQSTDAQEDGQNEKCSEERNNGMDYLIHGMFPSAP